MSKLQVNQIYNKDADGAPTLPAGVVVTGVSTADCFKGNITGTAGTITTLSATTVSIGGTLTYEDVTNIDSVGVITARTGVDVTAGGINVTAGGITVQAGIATLPANSTIGGKVPATTGKAIAMAMVFG